MTTETNEEAESPRVRALASVRKGWWFLAAGVTTAVIGAAASVYVPKILDPQDTRPIAVNVVNNPATVNTWSGEKFGFVMPKDVTPVGQPSTDCGRMVDWVRRNRAADHQATRVRLVIQGATDKGVLIENLRAKIIRRSVKPEPAGIGFRCGGTQGEASPRQLVIDLDSEGRAADYAEKVPGQLKPFGFTLQKGETEIFDLAATTKGTVDWVIQLDLVVGGERQTVEVNNRGKSFMTTAWNSERIYQVPPGTQDWVVCTKSPHERCKGGISPADFRYTS
ncbi:hypothetical protein QWM81_03100 [Streptomyces ficellus]|uniref:Uncharacterized protein n=1 Tax=Streptomyces ficellus TaxID=1977088 RepID=A0ABT7Z0N1_9ACTN|nr:hypothetical protein [Streptomyces ficellus]MDN3293048.1 hypothetical protein [Streptomyces ficellus]